MTISNYNNGTVKDQDGNIDNLHNPCNSIEAQKFPPECPDDSPDDSIDHSHQKAHFENIGKFHVTRYQEQRKFIINFYSIEYC